MGRGFGRCRTWLTSVPLSGVGQNKIRIESRNKNDELVRFPHNGNDGILEL